MNQGQGGRKFCHGLSAVARSHPQDWWAGGGWRSAAVLVVLFSAFASPTVSDSDSQATVTTQAIGIVGGNVELLCNTTVTSPSNPVILVIWYKNGGDPVYSYDLRGRAPNHAKHWADMHVLGKRANFHLSRPDSQDRRPSEDQRGLPPDRWPPGISVLGLRGISTNDRGLYRCRVDFHAAPTRNSMANLTVIVPPRMPIIVDEAGIEAASAIGPYPEDASIRVSCEVRGGSPKPQIRWFRSGILLSSGSEVSSGLTVTSTMVIPNLKRVDNGALLTCQASNNNISRPVQRSVTIIMNLPPTAVWIQRKDRHLLVGKEVNFQCSSSGSAPRTRFQWFLGSEPLNRVSATTPESSTPSLSTAQEIGTQTTLSFPTTFRQSNLNHQQPLNVNVSVISYIPLISDQGQELRCLVDNPGLEDSTIEDSLVLEIHYPPILSLTHGSNLDLSTIKEGDDVYFECQVQSRPSVDKITWHLNDNMLGQDLDAGIIIANRTLVLQRVRRVHSGFYTCRAKNVEGEASSNKIELNVKYSPVCSHDEAKMFGVAAMENMNLVCDVQAYPTALKFHWRFNNSGDEEFDLDNFVSNETRSVLTFSPMTKRDYGTILCFANNEVGRQREACMFQIVPAGPPQEPIDCSQYNHSSDAIHISCTPGYDGGMEQIFTLELFEQGTHQVVRNLTLAYPAFVVSRLEAAAIFEARVFASNQKGRSPPVEVKVSTLKRPSEKRLATTASGGSAVGGQHPPTGVLVREESSDEALSSVHAGSNTHEGPNLMSALPSRTVLIILVSALGLSLIVVVVVGVICRIQCRMTTHASTRMTTSSSSQEILAGKSSIVGASSSSLLLSQHHHSRGGQEGLAHEDSDFEQPINNEKDHTRSSDYILHDNFLEPMAGEILPMPGGGSTEAQSRPNSQSRRPSSNALPGASQSQAYSDFYVSGSQRISSTFKGDPPDHPGTFPPPPAGLNSRVPPGSHHHFHPGSILNPSQLQHSCTNSFVASQPATSMSSNERRGSSEILSGLPPCSNNSLGLTGSSPQPSNFMPPPMGEINSSSYIHTFPRQHHQRLQPLEPSCGSLSPAAVPNSRSMHSGFEDHSGGSLSKKGERRKTVTFLGDVQTFQSDGVDPMMGLGEPRQSSIMSEDPRSLLSPSSEATSSEGDEYVESRV